MVVTLAPHLLRAAQTTSTAFPVIKIATPIVLVAIFVFSKMSNQVEKAQRELEELKEIVKKYDDLQQVRGEDRQVLISALDTIQKTVEKAVLRLPQAADEHEKHVPEHREALFSLAESVVRFRVQYDETIRYEQDMAEISAIVDRIKESKLEESFKKFGGNLRSLIHYLKTQKEM